MLWCMERTNIYLDSRQRDALDRLAEDEGVSRAELIRKLLDRALRGGSRDLEGDLLAIEKSFGVLADIDAPPRQPDARSAHLERMWQIGA